MQLTESMLQKHYDEFYEEVFYEIESKYGEIEEMNVCENLGDHIVGNVYIKFYKWDFWLFFSRRSIDSPNLTFGEMVCLL